LPDLGQIQTPHLQGCGDVPLFTSLPWNGTVMVVIKPPLGPAQGSSNPSSGLSSTLSY
jgi:hypothetical protein